MTATIHVTSHSWLAAYKNPPKPETIQSHGAPWCQLTTKPSGKCARCWWSWSI